MLTVSMNVYSQNNPELVIIRWATVAKATMNIEKPYIYIIDENSNVEKIDINKENLKDGESAVLIHKMLKEYYSKGYKMLSNNFSTTVNGLCDKGEYILIKE